MSGPSYEAVIRINSQSGKGGISYIMETEYGIQMPRALQVEFSGVVQEISDGTGEEQRAEDIWQAFENEYLNATTPYQFVEHVTRPGTHASEVRELTATVRKDGRELELTGKGNGPIAAYVDAIGRDAGVEVKVFSYSEHSVNSGADATAIAFVETEVDGQAPLRCRAQRQHRVGVADRGDVCGEPGVGCAAPEHSETVFQAAMACGAAWTCDLAKPVNRQD